MNLNTSSLRTLAIELLAEIDGLGKEQAETFLEDVSLEKPLQFYETMRNLEIKIIKEALLKTNGNQTRASRLLGLRLTTLNSKIKTYGIKVTRISLD